MLQARPRVAFPPKINAYVDAIVRKRPQERLRGPDGTVGIGTREDEMEELSEVNTFVPSRNLDAED